MNYTFEMMREIWYKYILKGLTPILYFIRSRKWEYTLNKSESVIQHVKSLFSEQVNNSIKEFEIDDLTYSNLSFQIKEIFNQLNKTNQESTPLTPRTDHSINHQKLLILSLSCIHLNNLLFNDLIDMLEELSEQINYYEEKKNHPIYYSIEKGPFEYLSKLMKSFMNFLFQNQIFKIEKEKNIKEKIEYLIGFRSKIASHCGRLRKLNLEFEKIKNIDHLMNHILDCLKCNSSFIELWDPNLGIHDIESKNVKIHELCLNIQNFNLIIQELKNKYNPPSYIRRKWLPFSIGFIISGCLSYYIYNHFDELKLNYYNLSSSIISFLYEHFFNPVHKIIKQVIQNHHKQLFNPIELKNESKILEIMLFEIGKDLYPNLDKNELLNRSSLHDASIYKDKFELESKSPFKNLIFGNLMRMILCQIQRFNVSFLEVMEKFDDIMKQNQINFDILATLPIILSFLFGLFSFKDYLNRYGSVSISHQKISNEFIEMEKILNRNYPSNNSLSFLTDEDEGFLISKILLSEKYLYSTNDPKLIKSLLKDLNEIDSNNYTILQKLRVISRIYRNPNYSILFNYNINKNSLFF